MVVVVCIGGRGVGTKWHRVQSDVIPTNIKQILYTIDIFYGCALCRVCEDRWRRL